MNRNTLFALAALGSLVGLVLAGKLEAAAVVTFVGGLMLDKPQLGE